MRRTPSLAALLLLSAAASRAQEGAGCRPTFLAAADFAMPEYPGTLHTPDVNLDGYPDLLVTSYAAPISVRLGQPGGGFGPPINHSGLGNPLTSTVGLFDAGSAPDVIVSGWSDDSRFFSGNGDGTFDPEVVIPGLGILQELVAADLNDDGALDIVGVTGAFQQPQGVIRIALGNGNGTFDSPQDVDTAAWPLSIAVGEVTGDDNLDLVAPDGFNSVSIYPGIGDGTFGAPSTVIAGGSLGEVLLRDVNTDGHEDMILTSGTFVAVLFGNGDGTFQAARNYATPIAPTWLAAADFDGNGHPDILATTNTPYPDNVDGAATLLTNDGTGLFSVGQRVVTGKDPAALAVADFGNDDRMDFAVINSSSTEANVIYGNGDGTFQAVRLSVFVPATPYSPAAKGDFDEDGRLDLAASNGGGFGVLRSIGGGAFAQGPTVPVSTLGPNALVAGVFDGDGHLDVATVSSYVVNVALGHGDGSFQEPSSIDLPRYSSSVGLTSGDFDGDGIADLAVTSWDFPLPSPGVLWVYLGNGDGTFAAPIESPLPDTSFGYAILAGRLNADPYDDLAVRASGGTTADIFLANGDGTFEGPTSYAISSGAISIAAADLRNTGHLDLLFGGSGIVMILPGNGDGTFGALENIVTASNIGSLDTADFNGDGNLDIITANFEPSNSTVLLGTGGGDFATPQTYWPGNASSVHAGDFDGNGRPDGAFIAPQDLSGVTVMLNADLAARVPDVSVVVGEPATLSVRAGGFGPLAYQWRRDGTPIPGETSATLAIDPADFDDAGSYDVVVTDDCGSTPSAAGILSVEFADVPVASPFHDDILAIATAGIAAGCGGGNYCPTSPVRRDQMAVFLLKAEHGSAYDPPACTGVFDDVPCPSPFADWIEQLAAEGVTTGCGVDVYCPSQSVTRAQMAVFLLKTKEGSGFTPPPATGIFGDVPVGSFAADFIEELYSRGITGGCSLSPLLYCPTSSVLRQQMATFLVRTFFP